MTIESIYTRTISNGPSATIEAVVAFDDLFAVAYNVDGFEGVCITPDPDNPEAAIEDYETLDDASESKYIKILKVAHKVLGYVGKSYK